MKLTELRKVIREEVREAIQEELKDILLEAVRSPKPTITAGSNFNPQTPISESTTPQMTNESKQAARQAIMSQMMAGQGNATLTSADVNTFQARPTDSANGKLPEGNVGLDQIMGLMNKK